jgi:predicted sugar kinase
MNPALWAVLGGAAALLLVALGVVWVLLRQHRGRGRRDAAVLAAAQADVAALRAQVEALSDELEETRRTASSTAAVPPGGFVITTAGADVVPAAPHRPVRSVTLAEPLVRIAALGHGVRRALSAESRNRITFEMRREVRRARKERRRAARRGRPSRPRSEAA